MERKITKYTKKERDQYLEEYKTSSLSIGKYCKERAIPESTFRGWIDKDKENKFGEISINDEETKFNNENITIIIDKIRIELKQGYNKKLLKNFMEVLVK